MTAGVLFISYDGMLEPLGQSQVLGYLRLLAAGRRIHLISFEKAEDWANAAERGRVSQDVANAGIVWHPLRYHKRPTALATSWDIICGSLLGLWLAARHRLRIIHGRSYVPSVMALIIARLTRAAFVFDMRGFWADERVEGGLWRADGRMYRIAKWFERRFLLSSDHVISLTSAAATEIKSFPFLKGAVPPITVIPTCADLNRFRPVSVSKRRENGGFVLGYVGSAGTWYLFDEVIKFFLLLRAVRGDVRLSIVNRGEHDFIRPRLAFAGITENEFHLRSAAHFEIPGLMSQMNAGIFFLKPVFSKKASAPTRLAEFLGCGIPCLGNTGVGDMADILEKEQVGIALEAFDEVSMKQAIERFLRLCEDPMISARCREAAMKHFSLEEGVRRYEAVYRTLCPTA